MPSSDGPTVGWGLMAWSRPSRRCNVAPCSRPITAGFVRADNKDPRAPGFVAVCTDCYFKIMAGIDPDPDAPVPDWEVRRRETADPDR